MDPFRAVQEEVRGTLTDIQGELAKWRKLPPKSPKAEQWRQHILASLSDLKVDLQDMQATIDIALRDPTKFALTPSELMMRQDFVRDLQAQANDACEMLEAAPVSTGGRGLMARGNNQRVDRQTLLSTNARASDDDAASPAQPYGCGCGDPGGSSASRQDHAAWQDNDNACNSAQQQQQQSMERQDAELSTIGKSVDRLGDMSRAINAELRTQGKELDAFSTEVSTWRARRRDSAPRLTVHHY